ncbi:MAG TPA: hypothetical protein VK522_24745 [Pseudolabrys sp.]|jgi:hypothetical protein|nr:hypothetical protein [Pseudolabrys sp.]
MPEQARQKRRRQILTDETANGLRFDARANENTRIPEDAWVRNFIVRLARMLRKTGGKN